MSYRLTKDPDVLFSIETSQFIHRGDWQWPTDWLGSNTPEPELPPYELNSAQHFQAIRSAAWDWMTAFVKERRYDNIETCVGYYNSGVERYRLEARAMVAWRDDVNLALEQLVLAPPVGIETWDQVRLLLPQPEAYPWPSAVELPLDTGDKVVLE